MKPVRTIGKPSEAGFTVIELLVIVVIIGVLAAIAAPSWLGFLNRQRANAVRSDLVATLKNTQQDAIQRRHSRQVKVIENTATTPPTIEVGPVGTPGLSQVLGSDANNRGKIVLVAPIDTIAFDYQGLPTNPENIPLVITITPESGVTQCVIVASLLGSIKTADGEACNNPAVTLN